MMLVLCPPQQVPASIVGEYRGAIGYQHVTITLMQAADGMLSGKLTVPDQGNVTLPFDTVAYTSGTLHVELNHFRLAMMASVRTRAKASPAPGGREARTFRSRCAGPEQ